ncbi:MAG: hypothetical protein E4H24_01735 [Thermomicrobiales bacterium]|nr:MAG: hypothetical protein E4H24_01735 [Thermomicrobiales bacterium]
MAAYRIRSIVALGFLLTFLGFGTVALYAVTGQDFTLTARMASLFIVAMNVRGLVEARPGPAWRDERQRRFSIGILLVLIALSLGNILVGSIEYLQVLLLLGRTGPMTIFYNTVSDSLRGEATVAKADPSDPRER